MAQADYVISANPTGLAMRTEVNQIFQAILTNNAGTVAPSTVSDGMLWGDMSNSSTFYLKIRNHTNDGWNDLYAYDVATKTIQAMANGSTVSALLSAKANLASPTFTGTVVLPSTTSIGTVSNTEIGYLDGVTSAIQTQLETKAPLASPTFTGTVGGITSSMVGLGSVNNTSDSDKPVSTATQTALNLKANLSSPDLTGTPTAPTANAGTNTTQIATTAFVNTEISNDVGVANSGLVKTALNASGTAPIYACRAWVNFNGTGTVAIRASGNVSSITDNGTGDYTVNFATSMIDENYTSNSSCQSYFVQNNLEMNPAGIGTVSSQRFVANAGTSTSTPADSPLCCVSIFR